MQLVEFQNREHIVSTAGNSFANNKVLHDNSGYYIETENGDRKYLFNREKYGLMPNWCPSCGHLMGRNHLDQKFWPIHKRCFKCSIAYETQMKIDGTWQQYEQRYILSNLITTCDEAIQFYTDLKAHSTRSVVINEEGETEQWDVKDITEFNGTIESFIKQIEEFKQGSINQVQLEIKHLNDSKIEVESIQQEISDPNISDSNISRDCNDEN